MTLAHADRAVRAAIAPLALTALLLLGTACTSTSPTTTASASTTSGPAVTAGRADRTSRPTAEPDEPTTEVDNPVTSATEVGQPPDACDLITEEDATAAFGEPATAGEQDRDECWWTSPNDLKTINLIRRTGEDVETWRRGYQNDQWEKNDFGDEGYSGRMLDSIVFRIGETTYEINVIYSTRGDPEQVVKDLAQTVVSRL